MLKKSILFLKIIIGLLLLSIATTVIINSRGYEVSLQSINEEAFEHLLTILFFLMSALLSLLILIKKRNHQIIRLISFIVLLVMFMLYGFFFMFERSTFKQEYFEAASYDMFLEKLDENRIYGTYLDKTNNQLERYENETGIINDILKTNSPVEYNKGLLKDIRFDAVVSVEQGSYYLIIDKSLTKLQINYSVDGIIYYDIYTRYYEIDYLTGKYIYDMANQSKK